MIWQLGACRCCDNRNGDNIEGEKDNEGKDGVEGTNRMAMAMGGEHENTTRQRATMDERVRLGSSTFNVQRSGCTILDMKD